jgi:hypothetical protein
MPAMLSKKGSQQGSSLLEEAVAMPKEAILKVHIRI